MAAQKSKGRRGPPSRQAITAAWKALGPPRPGRLLGEIHFKLLLPAWVLSKRLLMHIFDSHSPISQKQIFNSLLFRVFKRILHWEMSSACREKIDPCASRHTHRLLQIQKPSEKLECHNWHQRAEKGVFMLMSQMEGLGKVCDMQQH